MSIDMMVPVKAAFLEGERKKRWTSYRERAIKEKEGNLFIPENSLPLLNLQGELLLVNP